MALRDDFYDDPNDYCGPASGKQEKKSRTLYYRWKYLCAADLHGEAIALLSKEKAIRRKGIVLTALRRTGKNFLVEQQLTGKAPWNWHVLCRTTEDYRHLTPLLKEVRGFAYADEIKVQEFDAFTNEQSIAEREREFYDAYNTVCPTRTWEDVTREEKIKVFDILKLIPYWRQRLIDRGMAGRAEDPNKWVNPTLNEIEEHFDAFFGKECAASQVFDEFAEEVGRGDYDQGGVGDSVAQFFAACRTITEDRSSSTFTREEKAKVWEQLKDIPYWRHRYEEASVLKTPVITDSRWPSEISRVLERFPEFLSVRLWAPDIPVVDDPSENSMLKEVTDFVFLRAPLTPFPVSEGAEPKTEWTSSELLNKFMVDYPQYWEHRTYVMA